MKKTFFNLVLSGLFFFGLFAASIWFFNYSGSGILTRIDSTDKEEDRLAIFSEALGIWESSPIFGKDIAVSAGFWPHNLPLEALMAVGIFGFLLIIPWIGALFKVFFDSQAENRQWLHIWFLQTTVMNMVTGSIWAASSLFVCLSLVLGGGKVLSHSHSRSARNSRRRKRRRKSRRKADFVSEGY
jgi:O-antigen ligase